MFLERFHSCFPRGALVFLPVLHSWTGELRGTVPESEFSSHAKFGFSAAPCCCEPGAPFASWYWGEGHCLEENVLIGTSPGQFSIRWNFSFLLQILRWLEPPRLASLAATLLVFRAQRKKALTQGAWISGWNPVFKKIFQNSQLIFTNKVYKNRPILMRFYVVCKGMWYYSIYLHIWPELEKLADLVYRVYTGIQFSSLACSHFFSSFSSTN